MPMSPLADLIGRQRNAMRDAIAIRLTADGVRGPVVGPMHIANQVLDTILDVLNEQNQLTDGERRHLAAEGGALPTEQERTRIDAFDALADAVRDYEGGDGSTPWALVVGNFPAETRVVTSHPLAAFAAMGLLSTGMKIAEQGRAEA